MSGWKPVSLGEKIFANGIAAIALVAFIAMPASGIAEWKTYRDEKGEFEIRYPTHSSENDRVFPGEHPAKELIGLPFAPGTSLEGKYLVVNVMDTAMSDCQPGSAMMDEQSGSPLKQMFNHVEFTKREGWENASGGQVAHIFAFGTYHKGKCISFLFSLDYHDRNFLLGAGASHVPPMFNEKKEAKIFGIIMRTFHFIKP